MSPSASVAERVPDRPDLMVPEAPSSSVMVPAVGAFRTGASLTALTSTKMVLAVGSVSTPELPVPPSS